MKRDGWVINVSCVYCVVSGKIDLVLLLIWIKTAFLFIIYSHALLKHEMCVCVFVSSWWLADRRPHFPCVQVLLFSEEIKKRDTRRKTFGSFHASSAAQRFFFHHMLIVVAPHLLPQKTSPHALLCHIGLMPRVAKNQSPTWNHYPIQEVTAIFGWWASRKHDRSSSHLSSLSWYLFTRTDGRYTLSPKTPQVILSASKSDGSFFSLDDLDGGGVTVNLISPLLFSCYGCTLLILLGIFSA